MYAGCGRAGDFAGDPLLTIGRYVLFWATPDQDAIRAAWQPAASLPGSPTWITYNAGVIVDHRAFAEGRAEEFTPAVDGTLPALAAVAVAEGVDDDGLYDPLGATATAANLTALNSFFQHDMRGAFRLENTALDLYELYRGVDAEPDLSGSPWETFASLPHETAALAAGHTYYFVLRKRNAHNLVSQNIVSTVIVVDAAGEEANYPSDPAEITLTAGAAGVGEVHGEYDYTQDGANAADYWIVWITTNGVDPNPADAPTRIEAMVKADGVARLNFTTAAAAGGATIKALVRARRNTAAAWTALTAYGLGDWIVPSTANAHHYECTRAGTTGADEPTWPTTNGNTVDDPDAGGAEWTCRAAGAHGVDSQNSAIVSCTADDTGPSAPAGQAFLGEAAKQEQ